MRICARSEFEARARGSDAASMASIVKTVPKKENATMVRRRDCKKEKVVSESASTEGSERDDALGGCERLELAEVDE